MTLGMSVGLRRTAWMMAGEVTGVAIVSTLSGIGVASLMLRYPRVFTVFTLLGGLYMGWLGLQMWRSRGSMAIHAEALAGTLAVSRRSLVTQGFVTAIANPKGWAFFMALLPPFLLTGGHLLNAHFAVILLVIVLCELLCMTLYAVGGKALGKVLRHRGNVAIINRVAGTLMIAVGLWLILQGR
ncbi:lysine exporter protein (lyse/ygga) [gamma proteobacterium NOR5-3]|nr:lysine exporter protein (lyse/ygga) [gamma proteobacterium NOR5-3]